MDFVIPKIEGDKSQSELFFGIFYQFFSKLLHVSNRVKTFFRFPDQTQQEFHHIGMATHPGQQATIRLIHECDIVYVFFVLQHSLNSAIEVDLPINNMVVLVYQH